MHKIMLTKVIFSYTYGRQIWWSDKNSNDVFDAHRQKLFKWRNVLELHLTNNSVCSFAVCSQEIYKIQYTSWTYMLFGGFFY